MTHSGDVLHWGDGPLLTDKHSTGGVGDKVSLILAPLWAELGFRVPMISGRGLGHTGGTLDKLESIPGFRCDLEAAALHTQLADVGVFINGQTGQLAPADKVLYGLRNETCTVPSIPLICGSILSKKLASGISRLVLDVKTGSGAFMKETAQAVALARTMVDVAKAAGLDCSAVITAMDRPLGRAIGNAVEVEESIAILKGAGPADLRTLVLEFANHPRAASVLASGAAYERFARMVSAQGGSLDVALLGGGVQEQVIVAERGGMVSCIDALDIGRAGFLLGAGRRHAEDAVDFGVGLWLEVDVGDSVVAGQPLVRVLHRGTGLNEAVACIRSGIRVGETVDEHLPLIVDRVN
jgi:pyrimidine-nucleoside phosphorylase